MLSTPAISPLATSPPAQLPSALAPKPANENVSVEKAREVKEAFAQFVGEAFFGQMLKSMRATVGEPAYFHGGHAEEQFQARLDQQLSQDMAANGASGFADQMFESQFPAEAALLKGAVEAAPTEGLHALNALRRR